MRCARTTEPGGDRTSRREVGMHGCRQALLPRTHASRRLHTPTPRDNHPDGAPRNAERLNVSWAELKAACVKMRVL
eukprot:366573-Chlamydomonas_euryale.AAC.40